MGHIKFLSVASSKKASFHLNAKNAIAIGSELIADLIKMRKTRQYGKIPAKQLEL